MSTGLDESGGAIGCDETGKIMTRFVFNGRLNHTRTSQVGWQALFLAALYTPFVGSGWNFSPVFRLPALGPARVAGVGGPVYCEKWARILTLNVDPGGTEKAREALGNELGLSGAEKSKGDFLRLDSPRKG